MSPQERFAGTVLGIEASVSAVVRICGESFPASKSTNEAAFDKWHKLHQRSLDDVARAYRSVLLRQSNGDESKAKTLTQKLHDSVVGMARDQYHALDPKEFEQLCRDFPKTLNQPEMEIDSRFATELADLRKHSGD